MTDFISSTFLTLDHRKYTNDIVVVGISPYDGQKHLIVKGGAKGISRRAQGLDMGNLVKAKVYQRHHWYLAESETIKTFSSIKSDLECIVLYQALLSLLKIAYVIPEKKLFSQIYMSLIAAEDEPIKERKELSLFLLSMRVLSHYDIAPFPFACATCGKKVYKGTLGTDIKYYCAEHSSSSGMRFSIETSRGRILFLQFVLKTLLNIDFDYTPITAHFQKASLPIHD
jgi:recombinational DNA repair protein (RecF pathway)